MLLNHYIITDEFKNNLEKIIKLGKSQNGIILSSQLDLYVDNEEDQNYKRDLIFDVLHKNNIIVTNGFQIKTEHEKKHDYVKYNFIDGEKIDLSNVKQIDECLTFEDFCDIYELQSDKEYIFSKKYNSNRYNNLAMKINHIENCPYCYGLIRMERDAIDLIYGTYMPEPEEKIKKELKDIYFKWNEEIKRRKEECDKNGHNFTKWEHDIWVSRWNQVVDYGIVKNKECCHNEWTRQCTNCGLIEKTEKEPKEVEEEKNKGKILRIKI